MKKMIRWMLCAGLMAALLCVPALAAQTDAPERQGDFYVLVNGEYITFTDAVPQIQNNRSCLPFVAVFEQLGFPAESMTWDQATKTVTAAKDGLTISLTIGQPVITLTDAEGASREITADTAPYVDRATNRTYVPFGLVADALGYRVGWDAAMRAVIIDDVDAILAANNATYELMEQYLAYSRTFNEGNQQVTGKYAMDMKVATAIEDKPVEVSLNLDGDYKALSAGSTQMQFTTDMALKLGATLNGADASEVIAAMGELPESIDMELRGDLGEGVFYFKSSALAEMMEQPEQAKAWYKLDIAGLYSGLGVDYSALMDMVMGLVDEASFEEYLTRLLAIAPLTSVDATTSDTLAALNAVLSDAAFQKSGDHYVNTLVDEDGVKCILTLYTKGGKVNGCAVELSAADESFGLLQLDYDLKDSKMEMVMNVSAAVDEESVSLAMTIAGTYKASADKPLIVPPANAQIIDLSEMFDSPSLLPSAA